MIAVTFSGTAFGGSGGKTFVRGGVFVTATDAVFAAMKHRDGWVKSHDGIGMRPVRPHTSVSSGGDLGKIEVSACGGWGDSLYINYKFENVK